MHRTETRFTPGIRLRVFHLRKYNSFLVPFIFFAIATANWDKDFGIYPVVGLPTFIGQSQMSGFNWYSLAFVFEILLISGLVLLSWHPRTSLFLGVSYELIQSFSYFLFYLEKLGRVDQSLYGVVWNDLFWLCAFPILLTMLYFEGRSVEERDQSDSNLSVD